MENIFCLESHIHLCSRHTSAIPAYVIKTCVTWHAISGTRYWGFVSPKLHVSTYRNQQHCWWFHESEEKSTSSTTKVLLFFTCARRSLKANPGLSTSNLLLSLSSIFGMFTSDTRDVWPGGSAKRRAQCILMFSVQSNACACVSICLILVYPSCSYSFLKFVFL